MTVRRLVLLGGGHTHVQVIEELGARSLAGDGVECVLVSPDRTTAYTGMLPGVIAGHYAERDCLIDLDALTRGAGWRFVQQRACALDAQRRTVRLSDGTSLSYDVLSVDTGSVADVEGIPGAERFAIPVRPFAAFLPVWAGIVDAAAAGAVRLVVIGGGAAGVEVALAMAYRLTRTRGAAGSGAVALVSDTKTVLPTHNARVRAAFERILARYGITQHRDSRVIAVDADAVHTSSGCTIAAERVIWCGGVAAPTWPRAAGLATDQRGFIAVDRTLRSISHAEIFGGGDIVTLTDSPHPKSGVFAVRHGPLLAHNLRAALSGDAFQAYSPQARSLALISAGSKFAVASWNGWSAQGKWVWRWKDHIDRRFVARFMTPWNDRTTT